MNKGRNVSVRMKPLLAFVAAVALFAPDAALAADKNDWDGYWWDTSDAGFKLGWVSGYAKAMDFAGSISITTCALNMPLYVKEYPGVDQKVMFQKLCLSDTQVTDAGLEYLKELTQLQQLDLDGTQVTDAGVTKLQQALPNCEIER